MKVKVIGRREEFELTIDRSNEKDKSCFADVSLTMNSYEIFTKVTGNLSFLCVDFESLMCCHNRFNSSHLWEMESNELLRLWHKFFVARTLEELGDEDVEFFNSEFLKVKLPFHSNFFDEFVFIGCRADAYWLIKTWHKYKDQIFDFRVHSQAFEQAIENTISYLRSEVLL